MKTLIEKLDKDHLCKCNKCDNILIDKNPQVDAKKFQLKGNEKELIKVNNEFWGCPECLTDDYLIDLL